MARPVLALRFRTKKAYLEAQKAAREQRLSLNEFVIRCVEDAINPAQKNVPTQAYASNSSYQDGIAGN